MNAGWTAGHVTGVVALIATAVALIAGTASALAVTFITRWAAILCRQTLLRSLAFGLCFAAATRFLVTATVAVHLYKRCVVVTIHLGCSKLCVVYIHVSMRT